MIMEKMKVSGLQRKGNYSGRWAALIKKATNVLDKMLVLASKSPRNYIIDQVRGVASYRGGQGVQSAYLISRDLI